MGLGIGITSSGSSSYVADSANDALYRAIQRGVVNIAFAGTSITRGENAQMEGYNIWTQEFMRQIQDRYPSVIFNNYNFGLDSRNISMLADPDFKGVVSPDPGDGTGYYAASSAYSWQSPSVVGETWLDHIISVEPDLVILEFGMNWNGSADDFETYYQTIITAVKAAAKRPSIALMTEMLPTITSDPYLDKNGRIKLYNEKTHELAMTNDCSVIDTGRLWQVLRDGNDPLVIQESFLSLDTLTKVAGSVATTLTFDSIEAPGTSIYATTVAESRDITITCTYTPAASGSSSNMSFGARFSTDEGESWADGIAAQIRGADIKVYENGSVVQTDFHSAITATQPHAIVVTITGSTMEIYIDAVLVSTYTTTKVDIGGASIGVINALIEECAYVVDQHFPIVDSSRPYTNNELTGNKTTAEWDNGDKADGGNSLNHPSRTGLQQTFYPAIREYVGNLFG